MNPKHYTRLAQKYGATGLTPPPDGKIMAVGKFQTPPSGQTFASEEGNILTAPVTLEIAIPAGYKPVHGIFYGIALSDNPTYRAIPFNIGDQEGKWVGSSAVSYGREDIGQGLVSVTFEDHPVFSTDSKLIVTAMPYETANYTISVQVECEASPNHLLKWRLETYDKIRKAYLDRVFEYNNEMAKISAELKQQENKLSPEFGVPPSKRKQLMLTELKKHCIAIFRRHWFEDTATTFSGGPPKFDFDQAIAKGNIIRFLEQSIEWNQMQYAFYPYFWARNSSWEDRIKKDDADYEFQQFMQAGAARVLIPVRPKFEEAFNHFLETGEAWNGTGEPPRISDPLYVSIVEELRELSGGTLDEPEPVGDPWEVRLPTNLILLRTSADLPAWQQEPEGSWDWVTVESG
ncbi:MAG: hypothetical protein HS126_31245 [Anaerolineales bacterium]|nr:hypothetical protein [Anaerolineales bacterium]